MELHKSCSCKPYDRIMHNAGSLRQSNFYAEHLYVRKSMHGVRLDSTLTLLTPFTSRQQQSCKSRWSIGVMNANTSLHSGNNVTLEGLDGQIGSPGDQPMRSQSLIYDKGPVGVRERLKTSGGFWRDMDLEERARDLGDYLEQLKEFQSKLESMIEQGKWQTVSTLVEANRKAVMQQVDEGNTGLEQAAMLDILIQLSMSLQDIEPIQLMLKLMKNILTSMDVSEPFLDAFVENMGSVFLVLGNKEEAISCYQRSLAIQESYVGKSSPELVGTLLGMAGVYSEPGEREKGRALYNRIISIYETSKGKDCEELGVPLMHLGYTFLEDQKLEEAEFCIRRALNIAEKNSAKGGRMGVATCALARVKLAKGDMEKATELYETGMDMMKNAGYWSSGDLALENMLMEVAEFYSIAGRTKEAQDLWEEVMHEKERLVGVNSPRLVVHLQNLATSYAQNGQYDRCEPLLRRSLKLLTLSLGPTAPQVSIPLEFLATTLHHLDKNKEAESLARQALSIREKNFPDDHLVIGEVCNILASILHANNKYNEALKHAWRALHIKERHFGKNSKELAWPLDLLLELLYELDKEEEAIPLMKRLEALLPNSSNTAP